MTSRTHNTAGDLAHRTALAIALPLLLLLSTWASGSQPTQKVVQGVNMFKSAVCSPGSSLPRCQPFPREPAKACEPGPQCMAYDSYVLSSVSSSHNCIYTLTGPANGPCTWAPIFPWLSKLAISLP